MDGANSLDAQQIEQIIERALDYFDPLPLTEIRVVILPRGHPWWSQILSVGGMQSFDSEGMPFILLSEGFDKKFPDPYATDIVIHELSHLIDVVTNGWTFEDPARWQITSYIAEQEGWI
jgi:hypothetical protein